MYNKIMVPLDGSKQAECVIPHLEKFITSLSAKDVVFVRVERQASEGIRGDWKQKEVDKKADAEAYLNQIVERVKHNGTKLHTEVIIGNVVESLAHYAEDNQFDLILMSTHIHTGLSRLTTGSVAEEVLHSTAVPILIIKDIAKVDEILFEYPL